MHAQCVRSKLFTGSIAAEPGVEPVLYTTIPRPARHTAYIRKWRLWSVNFITGILLATFYWIQLAAEDPNLWFKGVPLVIPLVLLVTFGIGWISAEIKARRVLSFLRSGYAVRATIEQCRIEETPGGNWFELQYRYPITNGKTSTGDITLSDETVERIGGMEVGTTFTLLMHPTRRFETLIYFAITEAEIPGAPPARTMLGKFALPTT